jgi:hypothetical protein
VNVPAQRAGHPADLPVYLLLIIFAWLGGALLYRNHKLHRESQRKKDEVVMKKRT